MAAAIQHQYPASARVLDIDEQKGAGILRAHRQLVKLRHQREKKPAKQIQPEPRPNLDQELKRQHSLHKQCHPCIVDCPDCKVQVLVNSFPFHLKVCSFKTSAGRDRRQKEYAHHQDALNKQILEALQRYLFLAKCRGASVERRRAALEDWLLLVKNQGNEGSGEETSLGVDDISTLLKGQDVNTSFKAPLHTLNAMLMASVMQSRHE
jgi:hypothetical protein